MNRLTSVSGTASNTYSYDGHGNISSKVTQSASYTYSYDDADRLTQVQSSGTTGSITQYAYNGLGHRISRQVDAPSQTSRYVLDIGGLTGPAPCVLAETNGSGQVVAYYVYGPGIGLVSKITPQDASFSYHYDGSGNTVCMTDSTGNVVNQYAYDEFGSILDSSETTPNPFRYVGKYGVMDEGTGLAGLLFMRARYYDPEIGRFLSPDPIGFAGGDLNLYAYVRNNPIRWIDPWGLTQEDVNRAILVLKTYHPEYYNDNAIVSMGKMSPKTEAYTDVWTGDITISNEFAKELNHNQQINLLETLAHEYQHSNDTVIQRLIDSIGDKFGYTTKNHWGIYLSSIDLSIEAYNAMYIPSSKNKCP